MSQGCSGLADRRVRAWRLHHDVREAARDRPGSAARGARDASAGTEAGRAGRSHPRAFAAARPVEADRGYGAATAGAGRSAPPCRSEEHTSELQSLMRISYAVFCLKKKKNNENM